jgi:DNA mismatch repair protein MSH5
MHVQQAYQIPAPHICMPMQVGLLVYMAHIGSFVPADSCVVGLTDRILTRLVSQEQLALHQSSFMADITQVRAADSQA